jgi:hypothetical protein
VPLRDETFPGGPVGVFVRAPYSAKAVFGSVSVLEAPAPPFLHAARKAVMPSTINPVAHRDSFRTRNNSRRIGDVNCDSAEQSKCLTDAKTQFASIQLKGRSRWSGLNRRPSAYEALALPLSYTGTRRANLFIRTATPSSKEVSEPDPSKCTAKMKRARALHPRPFRNGLMGLIFPAPLPQANG